jgi:5-methylcytosine-specific restriction endonuclease McrA
MTPKRRLEVLLKCGGRCAKCNEKVGKLYIVDHVLALELGGSDELGNLEAVCITCDKVKTRGDQGRIAKMRRQSKMNEEREPSRMPSRPFNKTLRRKLNGTVERRPNTQTEQT